MYIALHLIQEKSSGKLFVMLPYRMILAEMEVKMANHFCRLFGSFADAMLLA